MSTYMYICIYIYCIPPKWCEAYPSSSLSLSLSRALPLYLSLLERIRRVPAGFHLRKMPLLSSAKEAQITRVAQSSSRRDDQNIGAEPEEIERQTEGVQAVLQMVVKAAEQSLPCKVFLYYIAWSILVQRKVEEDYVCAFVSVCQCVCVCVPCESFPATLFCLLKHGGQ